MSVWRIKGVANTTRSRAEAAAEKSGTPLGAWLGAEIMRRLNGQDKSPAVSAAPAAAPDNGQPAQPADNPLSPTPSSTPAKRGRRKRKGKSVAQVSAPGDAEAPIAATATRVDATEPAIAADEVDFAATTTSDLTPGDIAPVVEQHLTEALDVGEPEQPPILTTPRTPLATADAARRSRLSPVPILAVGALVAALAVGGYFVFADRTSDDVSTATAAGATTAAPPATPAATSPATPASPPAASVSPPSSAPPAAGNVATGTPSSSAAPAAAPNVPPPAPGVQPSLLVPVPRADGSSTAVTLAPPAPDFPTRPGPVVAQQDSIASLLTRAEGGDVDAQLELAKRYMQGAPAEQKPVEALRWLEKAADAGNGQAQFNVAVMYERGMGTPVDLDKAIGWYRKAAAQPVAITQAMHNLALLYITGSGGIAADPVQGRVLMARAAELGLPESQYSLALMHFQGVGGPPDKVAALGWLLVVARSNAPALVNAVNQLSGSLSQPERDKAQELALQHVKRINENAARRRNLAAEVPNPVSAGDKALDRAGIVEVQKLLATLKLYAGPADGAMGPKTEQAIREYQAMASLPEDGKATVNLLTSLRDVAGAVTPKPAGKP